MADCLPLKDQLLALPDRLRNAIGAIHIEQGFPVARAHCSVNLYGESHYDVRPEPAGTSDKRYLAAVRQQSGTQTDPALTIQPRPPGPRSVDDEPPVAMTDISRHPGIDLDIPSDVWPQVEDVVQSRVLGTAEANEHTVVEGTHVGRKTWIISGRGKPRSPERSEWLKTCNESVDHD